MNTDETCHVDSTCFHDKLGSSKYPFEKGRYWLFTSKICPFAHRTEIARLLCGLTDHIDLTIAGPVQSAEGWNLEEHSNSPESTDCPIDGIKSLPEIYCLSEPGYTGRASVPVLFDTKTNTIINNESSEIIRQFDSLSTSLNSHLSLYPANKHKLINKLTDELANDLIGPIYRAGFAKDQSTYLTNLERVFGYLHRLEHHLAKSGRYLAGDQLTLADLHAFPHLSRFDPAYHSLYRLNLNYLCDFPRITTYMKRLGEIPAFSKTLDIKALKEGYFLSWNQPTNGHFIPAGPIVNPLTGIAKKS